MQRLHDQSSVWVRFAILNLVFRRIALDSSTCGNEELLLRVIHMLEQARNKLEQGWNKLESGRNKFKQGQTEAGARFGTSWNQEQAGTRLE